jgi:hypothetical protein
MVHIKQFFIKFSSSFLWTEIPFSIILIKEKEVYKILGCIIKFQNEEIFCKCSSIYYLGKFQHRKKITQINRILHEIKSRV